ncbi:ATP-binding protein [Streptomyces sp. NBC_00286]|uniref:ATP-binding protein n=1 Tax=Streptomyces sp. NBC_00286 TaxID=2975701 RepID=UPI002E283233|nr:ATP-binding protein [Streptomyces sp. NBC_00286]
MILHARIHPLLPFLDTTPRVARDFVASVLRSQQLGDLADDAALCTSELVTNACVHAKGADAVLRLAVGEPLAAVRVTVYDGDLQPPVLREGCHGESGRGMWLVDALTEGRWGTEPDAAHSVGPPPGGKSVWFELGALGPSGLCREGADG